MALIYRRQLFPLRQKIAIAISSVFRELRPPEHAMGWLADKLPTLKRNANQ